MAFVKIPVDEIFGGCRMILNGKDIRQEGGGDKSKTMLYVPNKRVALSYFKNQAELSPVCSNCGRTENFTGKNRRDVAQKLYVLGWRKDDEYKNITVHHCYDCC
jgi:hypothetical protein